MARSRKGKTKFPKLKKNKRAKKHGFRKRRKSKGGNVLKSRRKKGRHQLTVGKGSSKNAKGNPAK